jgi:type IV secretion system protein VirB4
MQLLPPLTRDSRVVRREKPAGAHLPYARHVDDVTLELRDGLLMQTIHLGGLLFETADSDELNYRAELRDAMLRAIGSSRFAIHHHVIRRRADVTLDASYADDFSARLDKRWRDRLAGRQMFVNELFLTILRRPLQGRLGWADQLRGLVGRASTPRHVALAAERRALDAAREALMAALSQYSPRTLSVYETADGIRSEPLELLSCLFNGEMRPVGLPHADLGMHVPWRRISFGQDTVELGPAGPLPRRFVGLVSIKDYPGQTMPGMFDELYRLPFEMHVGQGFAFVERSEALGRMNLALRRMRSAEDDALSLRDELVQAKDDVAAGRAAFGQHHTTIAVHSESVDELNGQVAEVIAMLGDLGINAVREDIALEPAFWSQFPGNFKYATRGGMVSTRNFAGLASLHNFPVGQAHGNHWGDAVTLFETTAAGPYFFNFHHNDLGNFTVIGPSGSGKTVVMNFLLAQARKFRPQIMFFDKDRGAELFIRAIGGQYDRLRPGEPTGLNPLQMPDTPENRQFLLEWLGCSSAGSKATRSSTCRTRSRPISRKRSSGGGCAIWPSCFAATAGPAPATSIRGSSRGGAAATARGCSTTSTTAPTSRSTSSAST